jgi:hypothetical protein
MAMLTYTDRVVLPKVASPSLMDFAVSLSRQPRFGGHTRRWWSVLDHTLFCDELVKAEQKPSETYPLRELRLAMLLHDAHEAITCDVPTDAKGAGLRALQADLDIVIMDRFYPEGMRGYRRWTANVKHYDLVALIAEAQVVGPPVSQQRLEEVEPRFAPTTQEHYNAIALLDMTLRRSRVFGHPPFEKDQTRHPAVREYLNRMNTLL